MTRKKLYLLAILSSLAGFTWLALNFLIPSLANADVHFCVFRAVTGIPCPACGSTRAILSAAHGDILKALYWNPVGLILLISMIVFPAWIILDLITGKESFFGFYKAFEKNIRKRWFYIPAIAVILANWLWNILKCF